MLDSWLFIRSTDVVLVSSEVIRRGDIALRYTKRMKVAAEFSISQAFSSVF